MYLENLREKIFKKDLGIGETFSAAFDLFKINNKNYLGSCKSKIE